MSTPEEELVKAGVDAIGEPAKEFLTKVAGGRHRHLEAEKEEEVEVAASR
jgi:hypothetical protein